MKALYAADLFCGAGGATTGLVRACDRLNRKLRLAAVNHWPRAVETHSKNHPGAAHFTEDLATMDPKKAVPGGRLDLLIAAPECTHHSVARGGKPIQDQSRASAWCVLRWCTALRVDRVLIENVPEFRTWGPLGRDGKPLKSRRGETFRAFVKALESLGYRVEWRILNAADYGAATSRRRLFIQAVRGRRPLNWPDQTHAPDPRPAIPGVGPQLARWRSARSIIDWRIRGTSIFGRKRPLSPNTIKRIEAGLRKFGGANAEPFLVLLRRHADGRALDLPIPTLTAGGEHVALCEPFVTTHNFPGSRDADGRYCRDVGEPLPVVTSQGNRFGLVAPFVTRVSGQGDDDCRSKSIDDPLGTITARNNFALVDPFLMGMSQSGSNGSRLRSIDDPLATVTMADDTAVCEPFIVPANYGERPGQAPRTHSLDGPLPTVLGSNIHALVEPFVLPQNGSNAPRSIEDPVPTVTTTSRGIGVCEPFAVPFYANGSADSLDDPLRTVTTKDRHALAEPVGPPRLDILFRMLQPEELGLAMGFPSDYVFTGNRGERVKQIGNAIEVNQAEALELAMLEDAA